MSIKSITIGGRTDIKKVTLGGGVLFEKAAPTPSYTWDAVLASIAAGTYATDYAIGDLIPLDLGTEGAINMQIVAFNADDRADGTGKSHITFISKELLVTSHRMNPRLSGDTGAREVGTGTIGGWEQSELRSWLKSTIKPKIPTDVRNSIVDVTKYSFIYNADETTVKNSATTDDVWIPSAREVFGGTGRESSGEYYSGVFNSAETRQKMKVDASSAGAWWLRSANTISFIHMVDTTGSKYDNGVVNSESKVALGFCL